MTQGTSIIQQVVKQGEGRGREERGEAKQAQANAKRGNKQRETKDSSGKRNSKRTPNNKQQQQHPTNSNKNNTSNSRNKTQKQQNNNKTAAAKQQTTKQGKTNQAAKNKAERQAEQAELTKGAWKCYNVHDCLKPSWQYHEPLKISVGVRKMAATIQERSVEARRREQSRSQRQTKNKTSRAAKKQHEQGSEAPNDLRLNCKLNTYIELPSQKILNMQPISGRLNI